VGRGNVGTFGGLEASLDDDLLGAALMARLAGDRSEKVELEGYGEEVTDGKKQRERVGLAGPFPRGSFGSGS
jgi:hypothetical protein